MFLQAGTGSRKPIELNLRDASPCSEDTLTGQVDALRPVLDRALALIADRVAACGDAAGPAGMIHDCRAALAAARHPANLADWCLAGVEAARQFLVRHATVESARRDEIVELAGLVHEAMTALAGDSDVFDQGLRRSAERFDALLRLDSLAEIKTRLAREVGELKRATEARHASWKATLCAFSTRISELEDRLAASEVQATADPLTGLANRAAFERALTELAGQRGSRFVLALVDVDDFKHVNDTHGHLAGDQVLIAVAASLRGAFRADDVLARHGGDEFGVLIKDVTPCQAETRVCAALDHAVMNRPFTEEGTSIVFTLSVGLAEFSAGDTTRSLLQRADEALYDAKRRGKNRVARREPAYLRDLCAK